jgi:hypothetical protein
MVRGCERRQTRLISLLDYEYFYICYCDRTRGLFRAWLKDKFGSAEKLNQAWGTHHPDFVDIQLPDYRRREPNDAKRYDWLDFNLWRFVDLLKWAKAQQRQIDPDIPTATCAPRYNFTKEWGESGSDVETLTEEVNDFCLNESPASTKYVDFLRSLSGNRKTIVEIEGSEYRNTMASFLHGLSALSLYWAWSDKPGSSERANQHPALALGRYEWRAVARRLAGLEASFRAARRRPVRAVYGAQRRGGWLWVSRAAASGGRRGPSPGVVQNCASDADRQRCFRHPFLDGHLGH